MDTTCYTCKYYLEDMTCNSCDCTQADNMTEEDYVEYFIEDKHNCPYYKETKEE